MTNLVIDVRHINKYFGNHHVVKDVSLQVKQGEIFGFLGPNGSGKTTTIRMLCGLLTPDSGEGHCLGYDILTQSKLIKQQVGYMTQKFSFYEDLTVYENFDFVARVYQLSDREHRIQQTIERFGLEKRRNQLTGELSGGWKQRVALAACLLHEPKLLLLDEPTAGVDPKARREFWDTLHELSIQGITTLVSTHYMDEAERCTRLAYIFMGDLLIAGKINEVIQHAQLTTYEIRGDHLAELAKQLKNTAGIDQVMVFGEVLHVSGRDKNLLVKAIAPFQQNSNYTWQLIPTSLEDVFISLSEVKEST